MSYSDLIVEAFAALHDNFYDSEGNAKPFYLRDKRSTQDDPLDEYIYNVLHDRIEGAACQKSSGPLISPDMVIFRPELCNGVPRSDLSDDLTRIVAIEVKKLERAKTGAVARPSGLDYNTTPPCGTVRVYDSDSRSLDIRGFYIFVCQELLAEEMNTFRITGLVVCDGNALNADFDLYLSAVGHRVKKIGLGTYHNGADRTRPMFIFANPLGTPELDHAVTLIHPAAALEQSFSNLRLVYRLIRSTKNGENLFYCYRKTEELPREYRVEDLRNAFLIPSRITTTQLRGKFRLPVRPL